MGEAFLPAAAPPPAQRCTFLRPREFPVPSCSPPPQPESISLQIHILKGGEGMTDFPVPSRARIFLRGGVVFKILLGQCNAGVGSFQNTFGPSPAPPCSDFAIGGAKAMHGAGNKGASEGGAERRSKACSPPRPRLPPPERDPHAHAPCKEGVAICDRSWGGLAAAPRAPPQNPSPGRLTGAAAAGTDPPPWRGGGPEAPRASPLHGGAARSGAPGAGQRRGGGARHPLPAEPRPECAGSPRPMQCNGLEPMSASFQGWGCLRHRSGAQSAPPGSKPACLPACSEGSPIAVHGADSQESEASLQPA